MTNGKKAQGIVVAIIGVVVTCRFEGHIPEIYNALEIPIEGGNSLICEVQQQLGEGAVKAVAMGSTDGLQRGVPVYDTGQPISVPVGPATLGRVFSVLGLPIDGGDPVQAGVERRPIHSPAPSFEDQST
jgi:F-type H+/Na+-transporting ATPase subunit beta